MTENERLKNALVWHDYAMRYALDAIAALISATEYNAISDKKVKEWHKARDAAISDCTTAYRALEQAQLVHTIGDDDDE